MKKTIVISSANNLIANRTHAKKLQPSLARTAPVALPMRHPQVKGPPFQSPRPPVLPQHFSNIATTNRIPVAPQPFQPRQRISALPTAPALVQRLASNASAGVPGLSPFRLVRSAQNAIQRSAMSNAQANQIATAINAAHTGAAENRNTQAVARYATGDPVVFSQREYKAFDAAIETAESKHSITINERVIGDHKDDEGIHAEMLAISWWLQGHTTKPTYIAASQGVCARCQAVLDAYKIPCGPKGGHLTKNWVHPHRHAEKTPSEAALKKIPQKVTKNTEYEW